MNPKPAPIAAHRRIAFRLALLRLWLRLRRRQAARQYRYTA